MVISPNADDVAEFKKLVHDELQWDPTDEEARQALVAVLYLTLFKMSRPQSVDAQNSSEATDFTVVETEDGGLCIRALLNSAKKTKE